MGDRSHPHHPASPVIYPGDNKRRYVKCDIIIILYPEFETLDVFGPVEVFGALPDSYHIRFFSREGGIIMSSQQVPVVTEPFSAPVSGEYILFIPGGAGIYPLMGDEPFIATLQNLARKAMYVLTVCTGSLLLARTGFLNGKRATTNKRLFSFTERPVLPGSERAGG